MFHLGTAPSRLLVACHNTLEIALAARLYSCSSVVAGSEQGSMWIETLLLLSLSRSTVMDCSRSIHAGSCCSSVGAPHLEPLVFRPRSTVKDCNRNIRASSCCSYAGGRTAGLVPPRNRLALMNRSRSIRADSCCSYAGERLAGLAFARYRSAVMNHNRRIRARNGCNSFGDPAAGPDWRSAGMKLGN